MKNISFMTKVCKNSSRNALMVAGVAIGFGIGAANVVYADDAMPQAHSDGVATAIGDTAITAKVKARLMKEDGLDKSDISVTTTNGVVTLDGSAASSKAKSMAETAAISVDGVKSVDNNLKAPGDSKTAAKTKRVVSDSWITTKVKSELLADSLSKGFEVSVETMQGVVVLKGTLANQEAINHVKNVAAKVEGVKSVDTSALTISAK
jgi:hyperosmotically inducible periplasmic protein